MMANNSRKSVSKKVKDPHTVVVLKEVKNNRALWDSTCPEYYSIDSRNDAWDSVASCAGLPVAQCKLIWRNVRAANLTHARRGLSNCNVNRQPFLYHEELTFWSIENDENTHSTPQSLGSQENVHKREPLSTLMSSTPQSLGSIRSVLEKDEREKKIDKKPFLSPIPEEKSCCGEVNSTFVPNEKNKLPSVRSVQAPHSKEVWRAKQRTTLKRKADTADCEEVLNALVPPGPVNVDSRTLMAASLAKLFKRLPPQTAFHLMIKFIETMNDAAKKAVSFDGSIYSESTNANINNSKIVYDVSTDKDDILTENKDKESTDSMKDYVNGILESDDDAIITSAHSITLRRRDLATLCGNKWLNDQVINFYLQLIQDRGQREGYPSVKVFSTFLFPALLAKDSSLVSEWNIHMPDIFDYKYCLVPIHNNDHWSLIIIHTNTRIIEYFDSLKIGNKACFQTVTDFVRKTTKNEIWMSSCIEDRPIQENGYDCGMFILAFAEQFTRPVPISFSQNDICKLRVQVAYEIATGNLLH